MLSRSSTQPEERYRMLSGHCPDAHCQTKLFFPSYDSSIECTGCGQRHERAALQGVQEVTDPEVALHNMVRNLLVGSSVPKQTTDSVKVLGLSNYHCKLLSPLLTHYGMDKQGQARPLVELGRPEVFDCSLLSDRAFLLQPEHVGIMGYGRDQTGSGRYLADTLECIQQLNAGQEVLIPIHADGDGHCLVHGISRALVGRELFWHALRTNLKAHFLAKLTLYKDQFREFLTDSEWAQIIAESDPDYLPSETEAFGLQNIHIFGLANVLHRPIILLDSMKGLQSPGDYSGVFLPAFVPIEDCCGKDGSLNKPLCIAWSSSGRNHFIALVGVKGRPLPRLPRWMLTKVWGTPRELIDTYIQFDSDGMCTVGGDRSLQDKYVQRLAAAMEDMFVEKYHLHPAVVADVHHYIYKRTGVVGVHQNIVIDNTRYAVENEQLFRCLLCGAVSQIKRSLPPPAAWLQPGGKLYDLVCSLHGALLADKVYTFPQYEMNFVYDSIKDELIPDQTSISPTQCAWCQGKQLRQIRADGSVVYYNGDRTTTPAPKTKCNCGFKHYWNGQEYDNNPAIFSVPLKWKGQCHEEEVLWFQEETIPKLNSNAYDIASALVQKHFPADFGSEKLVQQVVETILQNTAAEQEEFQPISLKDMPSTSSFDQSAASTKSPSHGGTIPNKAGCQASRPLGKQSTPCTQASHRVGSPREKKSKALDDSPSKIILTGNVGKTLHKEELTMSEAERNLLRRIHEKAAITQQRQHSLTESKQQQGLGTRSNPLKSTSTMPKAGSTHQDSSQPDADKDVAVITAVTSAVKTPRQKRIRLTSSDGKQAMLVLDPSTTYSELQAKIDDELHIPVAKQRIRYGFPPKELAAPDGYRANEPVPLQNGDKVTVEVIASKAQTVDTTPSEHTLSSAPGSSTFPEGKSKFTSREDILRGMEMLQKETAGDNLDLQLYSLNLTATLTNTDLWAYVQQKAALFERGGLFYAIVERDLGLADGKHFMLPSIPNKKFTYNGMEDRLELCLEPIGHFPVRPGVDSAENKGGRIRPSTADGPEGQKEAESSMGSPGRSEEGYPSSVRSKLTAGGSGVVSPGGQRVPGSYRAFSGHAHTLTMGSMADHAHTLAMGSMADHTHTLAMGSTADHAHTLAMGSTADHAHTLAMGSTADHAHTLAMGSTADHAHTLAMGSMADHAHTLAMGSMADHAHTLAMGSMADHAHTLAMGSMADHAHTLAMGSMADQSRTEQASSTDTPRWAQFQREFNQMLEEKERQAAQGQAALAAAKALADTSKSQEASGQWTEAGQAPEGPGNSQEGLRIGHAARDLGGGEARPMATDTGHTNTSKDHTLTTAVEEPSAEGLDTPMDVDVEAPQRPCQPSSALPMDVDTAGHVPDEGGGSLANPLPSAQQPDSQQAEKPPSPTEEDSSPIYVAKRLGPGYSILIEQPSPELSDSKQTDTPNKRI